MTALAPPLTTFLREYLTRDCGASAHTVANYATGFKRFLYFVCEKQNLRPCLLKLKDLNVDLILDFLDHLENHCGNSVRTRNLRLAATKSFSAIWSSARPRIWPDRCMRFRRNLDAVQVLGKGRRTRILPLFKATKPLLGKWLKIRPERGAPPFPEHPRNRDAPQGVNHRLAVHLDTARKQQPSLLNKHVSPHTLRHSCALHTLESTGDLRKVSLWLGHASIQSTEIYLRMDPSQKREMMAAGFPADIRVGTFSEAPDRLMTPSVTPHFGERGEGCRFEMEAGKEIATSNPDETRFNHGRLESVRKLDYPSLQQGPDQTVQFHVGQLA